MKKLAFVNEQISFLSQDFNIYGADLLLTCPVAKLILPIFFQWFLQHEAGGNKDKENPTSGFYMKLWPILEKTLNCTQVFGVVCL